MNLFFPEHLERLCRQYGLRPSRDYGQNYLTDPLVIEAIIEAGKVSKDDTVVEVGPGFGVLTLPLADTAGKVVAFEIEKKIERYWAEHVKERPNIEVVWGNALKQFPDYCEKHLQSGYKVVANLPYQITSAIIRAFLEAPIKPQKMVVMVQKEVAERVAALPGDMSLLGLSVQLYAKPELVYQVPRTAFWPAPQVDSAVLAITPYEKPLPMRVTEDFLFEVARVGFANRRKLLLKNLLPLIDKKNKTALEGIFSELRLNPETARAQELSVETWIALAERIQDVLKQEKK